MVLCSKEAGTSKHNSQQYKKSEALLVLSTKALSLYESAKAVNVTCSLA